MAYTASTPTVFVLGQETDGNRENRDFVSGTAYDLGTDYDSDGSAYTADATEFPVI